MVMVWSLLGLGVAIFGVFLYRIGRKLIGGVLVFVTALLSFHPS
jgi:hypothetical protein